MKIITLEEKKKIMLSMLSELDTFCRFNEINYFLTGGTLLGAIRHNGYIPWDDDIDICLLRSDYEKLLTIFKSESGNLKLLNYENTKGYIWPFAKLVDKRTLLVENKYKLDEMGVYIDVFPMDNLAGNFEEVKKFTLQVKRIKDLLTLKHLRVEKNRKFIKNLVIIFGKILYLVPDKYLIKRIEKLSKKFEKEECEYICNLSGAWGVREITKKEYFKYSIKHTFEDKEFFIPNGYDQYLQGVYGNYMEFPPVEKQITHHSSVEYWKD